MVLEESRGGPRRFGHGDRGPRQGNDVSYRPLPAGEECRGARALSGRDQTRADVAVCLRVDAAGLFVRSRGDRGEGLSALIFLSVLLFSQSVLAMRGTCRAQPPRTRLKPRLKG